MQRKGAAGNVHMEELSSIVQMPGLPDTMEMKGLAGRVQISWLKAWGFWAIQDSSLPSVGFNLLTAESQQQ